MKINVRERVMRTNILNYLYIVYSIVAYTLEIIYRILAHFVNIYRHADISTTFSYIIKPIKPVNSKHPNVLQ